MDSRYSSLHTAQYTPRQLKAAEAKLKKLQENNSRLREQLDIRRVPISESAHSLIRYVMSNRDPLLPSVWGPVDKRDNPYQELHKGPCDSCMVL
ncbi:hypothetical protein HK098_004308 [Nowakowskiella sp. JEL0407]|nr:hypothetical protein HK098_004308 [Nowakowskiella sp. JEL0407]